MKKAVNIIFLSVLIISMFASFASAATFAESTKNVISGAVEVVAAIAEPLLGEVTNGINTATVSISAGELLFAKVLFFIIILSIVWKALEKVPFFGDQDWVLWLVSISVGILSTRFIGTYIYTILLPYTTLGVALTSAIPFVVYFIVINLGLTEQKYKTVRKIAWIFFALIFVGLWATRGNGGTGSTDISWIYGVTAIIAFIVAAMDGTISKFFSKMSLDKFESTHNQALVEGYKKKMLETIQNVQQEIIEPEEGERRIKKYKRLIAKYSK